MRALLLSLCCCLLYGFDAKEVRVALKAGWSAAPLAAETAEYLWEERRDYFWPFLESMSRDAGNTSDVDCWDMLLSVEEERRRMHLAVSLGLRHHAPKAEIRRQHHPGSPMSCCRAEIQMAGAFKVFLDVQTLNAYLRDADVNTSNADNVRDFDFEYGRSQSGHLVVMHYAPIGAECFLSFHEALESAVKEKGIRYIFRPVIDEICLESRWHRCARFGGGELKLGGFGVELALKNTEYIAMDDAAHGTTPLTDMPETENIPYASLGRQTMQYILQSKHPLKTATEILQDFPSHAATLSKVEVEVEMSYAVQSVSRIVASDRSFMLFNGMSISMDDTDFMEFWNQLRNELAASEQLRGLKISEEVVGGLLKLRALDKTEELGDIRFDILPLNDIIFLNDIEHDTAYRQYFKSLEILLSPYVRSGMIPIRKNLINVVFFVELGSAVGLEMAKFMKELMDENIPIRMGIVPLLPSWCDGDDVKDNQEREEQILKHFLALYLSSGPKAALTFWVSIEEHEGDLQTLFKSTLSENEMADEKLSSKIESYLEAQPVFVRASGLCTRSGPTLWLNGRLVQLESENVYRMVMYQARLETRFLQQLVYMGELTDAHRDILGTIFRKTSTFKKYSPYIEQNAQHIQSLLLTDVHFGDAFTIVSNPRGQLHDAHVMHWIVGNVASKEALGIIRSALMFVMSPDGSTSQLAFNLTFGESCLLQKLWTMVAPNRKGQEAKFIAFWIQLLSNGDVVDALLGNQSKADKLQSVLSELCKTVDCGVDLIEMASDQNCSLVKTALDGFPGLEMDVKTELAVISNGRLIFPLSHQSPTAKGSLKGSLTVDDFAILSTIAEKHQMGRSIGLLLNRTLDVTDADRLTELTVRAASILRKYHVSNPDASTLQAFFNRVTKKVMFKGQGDNSALELRVLLNPVSSTAQKWMPILKWLDEVFSAKISVFLHPQSIEETMPLKQYYRLALPHPIISESGRLMKIQAPEAHFDAVPERSLLTLNPDTPSAWLIEPLMAKLDLDNLRMMDLEEETLFVEYGLESILLTGSCYDTTAKTSQDVHPRGMQLTLGKEGETPRVDTLVMSNLGYFQLKANPGIWNLNLADGRSRELYYIDPQMADDPSIQLATASSEVTSLSFILDSFLGTQLILRVRKRPGLESEDVLSVPSTTTASAMPLVDAVLLMTGFKRSSDLASQTKQMASTSSNWSACEHSDDPINVFTIASGHMYERLQKIMILSVLKNTKSCVKFWFIKNDMSPQIKDFLPDFAKKYEFEYGLITYKWPTWLHHQKEKQRKIWAYKILFLDVLFPLSMRRVLFLDSDQIIRTDIRTLYDMDIQGAPLAYTPFCDNNKEMDPFRFWKGGFWEKHLGGKPYHISALYVVDLIKFRQMAAGDHLRVVYEQLSKDPNSLANLDQDLPNFTQHEVPIFSLPQEWLWCESWCGNDTKHLAKTIDLCNNPKTKEPKLQAARRIVTEWSDLDEEARSYTDAVTKKAATQNAHNPSKKSNHDTTEL